MPTTRSGTLISGTVHDSMTNRPVSFVIVSVSDTNVSTIANRRGRYSLSLPAGEWRVEFRKIGYRMQAVTISVGSDNLTNDVAMAPLPLELAAVTIRGKRDDAATRIIRRAIERKNDVLARIHDYRYDAYIKFVVRDLNKSADSADAIFLLTETQTQAYWEQPDKYQETIVARKQSSNLDAQNNLVSVGQIVNFNKDRVDLQKYSVVSPIADDALNHYHYYVADTLYEGGRTVFRLGIQPKSDAEPLFVGMIDIADSTYDVLAVEVGANAAVRFEFFDNLRYRQRFSNVSADYWMPTEIRFSGQVHLGVPIPGFPEQLSFVHTALLQDFRFDEGHPPVGLDEFEVVVDRGADDVDSLEWESRRRVPLTEIESTAYERIDSLEHVPKPVGTKIFEGTLDAFLLTFNRDFFHFNRVEGGYVGAGVTLRDIRPDLIVRAKSGYALEKEKWQHQYGVQFRLSERQRLWLGISYHDEVISRPTVAPGIRNTTHLALLARLDPLDYYVEEGFTVSLSTKVADFTQLRLQYNDVDQASIGVVTDYAVFDPDRRQRSNPPIVDGRLRSISGTLTYDSRKLLKLKGRDFYINSFTRTRMSVGAEYATPDLIHTDFDFFRYWARFERRQRTLNLGMTTISLFAGASSSKLPPQRYYTVDFGNGVFFEGGGFNTLNETNFSGNRTALFFLTHDFDQQLFRRSHIPLVRDIPFTFSVHGGAFWTDFIDHRPNPGDANILIAPSAYGEVGFGIGNLTPMISPFNFTAWFTWQVSSYDTDRFVFRIGVPGP
ncbi:MAG: DUF5686 family protein [Gemmatimonadales bacterium]